MMHTDIPGNMVSCDLEQRAGLARCCQFGQALCLSCTTSALMVAEANECFQIHRSAEAVQGNVACPHHAASTKQSCYLPRNCT